MKDPRSSGELVPNWRRRLQTPARSFDATSEDAMQQTTPPLPKALSLAEAEQSLTSTATHGLTALPTNRKSKPSWHELFLQVLSERRCRRRVCVQHGVSQCCRNRRVSREKHGPFIPKPHASAKAALPHNIDLSLSSPRPFSTASKLANTPCSLQPSTTLQGTQGEVGR